MTKPRSFSEALKWHLEHEGGSPSKIAQASGVTRNVLNKLKQGYITTTTAENARKIAECYGKTVEQFLDCLPLDAEQADDKDLDRLFEAGFRELRPDQKRMILRMLSALLDDPSAPQSGPLFTRKASTKS